MGLALRPNIGMWKYIRICINTLTIEELTVSDYLKFKEGLTEAGGSSRTFGTCKEPPNAVTRYVVVWHGHLSLQQNATGVCVS